VGFRPFFLSEFELLESGFALMMLGVCVRALRIIDEESYLGELVILNRVRSNRSFRATYFPQQCYFARLDISNEENLLTL